MKNKKLKIAFIISNFPTISETFIINQIADLMDRGVEVDIYSLGDGKQDSISEKYFEYGMNKNVKYIQVPKNKLVRLMKGLVKFLHIAIVSPGYLFRIFNIKKYGQYTWSGKLLFWVEPWLGNAYDLVHCHFGTVANKYLLIREVLKHQQPFITTFYGYDVSHIFTQKGKHYYDKLKQECSLFFVMSDNMKERVVDYGFNINKIKVLPISVDVESYQFTERFLSDNKEIKMVTVARFVEKKGLDDLLKALAIVKQKTNKKFKCTIVGDGPLKKEIYTLADDLGINNILDFKGYMKVEEVIDLFMTHHFYIQPSKIAKDGDME